MRAQHIDKRFGGRWSLRHRRVWLTGVVPIVLIASSIVVLFATAQIAQADSATLTVTNTAGQSDPAAGLPRVFTVSGVAAVPEELFVLSRPTGGTLRSYRL